MKKTTGLAMIAQERQEQLEIQSKYPVSDDAYVNGELLEVAATIITGRIGQYPSDWGLDWLNKTKAKPIKERLAIAGALIAAEIDRINKVESRLEEIRNSVPDGNTQTSEERKNPNQ